MGGKDIIMKSTHTQAINILHCKLFLHALEVE